MTKKMIKQSSILALTLAVICAIVIVVTDKPQQLPSVHMSWDRGFDNEVDLINESDLVVYATVKDAALEQRADLFFTIYTLDVIKVLGGDQTVRLTPFKDAAIEDTVFEDAAVEDTVFEDTAIGDAILEVIAPEDIYEDSSYTVIGNTMIKGLEKNAEIKVLMTGGESGDNAIYTPKEQPLMKIGATYLLFLQKTDEGHYLIMGGFQGYGEVDASGTVDFSTKMEATEALDNKNILDIEAIVYTIEESAIEK